MGVSSIFVLVILAINLWHDVAAAPATRSLKSENLHSRRKLISNGLGATPQMGWDSWSRFFCQINDKIIRTQADLLVSTGLSAVGYEYLIIDDCWGQANRDAQGNLVASPLVFPVGIQPLADHIHSLGLKLGLYAEAGTLSCTGTTAGSLGHEEHDAQTFASWGVDYLKYDNCNSDGSPAESRFSNMSAALLKTGRPIFFSVCDWGTAEPALWAPAIANSWRTTYNIDHYWESIMDIADANNKWAGYAGPGGWNDPDMLETGNGMLSVEEYRSQFSLWAIMKAPLLISTDLMTITNDSLEILTNVEVIAVNQDPLGIQGKKVKQNGGFEVWAGPLSNKRVVVLLLNKSDQPSTITATWKDIGLAGSTLVQVRDIWLHQDLSPEVQGTFTYRNIGPHACKMFVFTIKSKSDGES